MGRDQVHAPLSLDGLRLQNQARGGCALVQRHIEAHARPGHRHSEAHARPQQCMHLLHRPRPDIRDINHSTTSRAQLSTRSCSNKQEHTPATYIAVGTSPHKRKHIRWTDIGHALSSRDLHARLVWGTLTSSAASGRPHLCL